MVLSTSNTCIFGIKILLVLHKNSTKIIYCVFTGIDYLFTSLNTLRESMLKEKHSEFEVYV